MVRRSSRGRRSTALFSEAEERRISRALRDRGLHPAALEVPQARRWQWAVRHNWVDGTLPEQVQELAELDEEHFSYAVLADALLRPHPWLADDALVERWASKLARLAEVVLDDLLLLERAATLHAKAPSRELLRLLATIRRDHALIATRRNTAEHLVADFDERLRTYVGTLAKEARATCATTMLVPDADVFEQGRLVVATDASGQGGQACGYGWITQDGRLGYGLTVTTQPHQAEMIAICKVATEPSLMEHSLLILSDSQSSVDLINRVLRNGISDVKRRSAHPIAWMRRAYEQRHRIRVAWVKGHAGHPLNDAADELARLAIDEGKGIEITDAVESIHECLRLSEYRNGRAA